MAKYGLIGRTLGYSQSQTIHSLIGNYEYDHIEVPDEGTLADVLANTEYSGFSVTNPYKTAVIPYLDEMSDLARVVGSVNTIKRYPDGRLKGFNTDIAGCMYTVQGKVEDKKCVILGSGGAARSAAAALEGLGAGEIVLISRNPENVDKELCDRYTVCGYNRLHLHYDAAVLINATPVGTTPDFAHSPLTDQRLSVRLFSRLELAVDFIYNPYRTKFLQDARRLTKCHTKSGLDMLIVQAIAARDLWLDRAEDSLEINAKVSEIKRQVLEKQLNIIAIGMPGSGKTTIFRRFAYELGKDFIDTDEETEKILGSSAEEILSLGETGIELFRAAEHDAVREACKHTGAVIATGGGTILNPMSRDYLRSNGIVVYVRRPLELLAVKGRPVSINRGVSDLFIERDRIYRRVCDMTLRNSRIFGAKNGGKSNSYNYELKGFVYYIARKMTKYLDNLADNHWT